jgi:hypothetical protein
MRVSRGDEATVTSFERAARPTIITAFSEYEPPFNIVAMSRRIIDSVPEKYLQGLTQVVLTNAGGLPRDRRRSVTKSRGRKARIKEARGLYHPASQQRGAWIEVFVDNALDRSGSGWDGWRGRWLQRANWFRETELSDVIFHEIGHHIHFTVRPEYREKEDVADVWKVRLQKNYIRQRYRLIRSLVGFLKLGRLIDHWVAKTSAKMLAKGHISRAEHEENVRVRKQPKI